MISPQHWFKPKGELMILRAKMQAKVESLELGLNTPLLLPFCFRDAANPGVLPYKQTTPF
jgi:hypothetical protein